MQDNTNEHKRRPRYKGTHPRAFHEKYKELNPERYAEDIEKVMARGDTPAGSHRPIMVAEILEVLAPKPGEIAVDGTLGYGGHATTLLPALLPGGRLYGLDVDPSELPKTEARLRAKGFTPEVLQDKRLTVVLVYEDGTELGDWRLLPGIADWHDDRLVIHPGVDAEDILIPPSAYDNITPVTAEMRTILGDAEYYVILHIGPDPDAPDHRMARFIPFE